MKNKKRTSYVKELNCMKREFNLIDQAKHYLENAEYYYSKIDKDNMQEDYYIRDCCLALQTCIELFVKGLVEHLTGLDYEHTHTFAKNINIINKNL